MAEEHEDDASLMRRWRESKDITARDELIDRHWDETCKWLRGQVNGDYPLANELTAQVFEVMLGKEDVEIESYAGYVRGVAKRVLRTHFRKLGGNRANEELDSPQDFSRGAFTLITTEENRGHLMAALESLSQQDQDYIDWYFVQGLKQKAIAIKDGVSVRTVHERLKRAEQHLTEELDRRGYDREGHRSLAAGLETWSRQREADDDPSER